MNKYTLSLNKSISVEKGGGKAASLSQLTALGLPVPWGFVVTTNAYRDHVGRLESNDRDNSLKESIESLELSKDLETEFRRAWERHVSPPVALRSSATVEDSEAASYAGQFWTALNVSSVEEALQELRRCWASGFTEHAASYRAAQTVGRMEMGVVVQEMVASEYAGVAFTLDPVTSDNSIYYAEWTEETGEMLVSGQDIAGRAWLAHNGDVKRMDCYASGKGPETTFYATLADTLSLIVESTVQAQDVEWVWTQEDDLYVVQSRPVTDTSSDDRPAGAPPVWVFPGRPAGGWTEKQHFLFDLWDEYNPSAIRPLDYDLYQGAVWQANIDMLEMEGNPPHVEDVSIIYRSVPVAVDPAARREHSVRSIPPSDYDSNSNLKEAMMRWPERAAELEDVFDAVDKDNLSELIEYVDEVAAFYRETQVVRLNSTNLWIDGENDAENQIEDLLAELSFDIDEAIETLRSGVSHKTHQMNQELHRLAQHFRDHGDDGTFEEELDKFLEDYSFFEYGGTLIGQSRESIFEQIKQIAESDGEIVDPVEQARQRAHKFKNKVADDLSASQAEKLDDALESLRHWIKLRENSKVEQERPLPLLRQGLDRIGALLVKDGLIERTDDVYLLTYDELQSACTGNLQNVDVSGRSSVIEWKEGKSWLPDSFRGEEHDKDDRVLIGTAGSSGVAEGPARRVHGPDEFGRVEEGDILIARATNPVWTQLFSRIAGVVVENGTRLSHAAIVAREFGIPAVVGVPGCFEVVSDGELLRVDGREGEVVRLDLSD